MLSEEILVKECLKFNRLAQKELYDRYAPKMRAVCYRYAKDSDEAQDILQEGFIKVYSKLGQFGGTGTLDGWIKRIIINTAIDSFNKSKKKQGIELPEDLAEENEEESPEIDKADFNDIFGYELLLKAEIKQEEILKLVVQLPEHFRIPFNLFFIENYSHKEISDFLKIDETTSRTRVNRAKKLLQKSLYDITMQKMTK